MDDAKGDDGGGTDSGLFAVRALQAYLDAAGATPAIRPDTVCAAIVATVKETVNTPMARGLVAGKPATVVMRNLQMALGAEPSRQVFAPGPFTSLNPANAFVTIAHAVTDAEERKTVETTPRFNLQNPAYSLQKFITSSILAFAVAARTEGALPAMVAELTDVLLSRTPNRVCFADYAVAIIVCARLAEGMANAGLDPMQDTQVSRVAAWVSRATFASLRDGVPSELPVWTTFGGSGAGNVPVCGVLGKLVPFTCVGAQLLLGFLPQNPKLRLQVCTGMLHYWTPRVRSGFLADVAHANTDESRAHACFALITVLRFAFEQHRAGTQLACIPQLVLLALETLFQPSTRRAQCLATVTTLLAEFPEYANPLAKEFSVMKRVCRDAGVELLEHAQRGAVLAFAEQIETWAKPGAWMLGRGMQQAYRFQQWGETARATGTTLWGLFCEPDDVARPQRTKDLVTAAARGAPSFDSPQYAPARLFNDISGARVPLECLDSTLFKPTSGKEPVRVPAGPGVRDVAGLVQTGAVHFTTHMSLWSTAWDTLLAGTRSAADAMTVLDFLHKLPKKYEFLRHVEGQPAYLSQLLENITGFESARLVDMELVVLMMHQVLADAVASAQTQRDLPQSVFSQWLNAAIVAGWLQRVMSHPRFAADDAGASKNQRAAARRYRLSIIFGTCTLVAPASRDRLLFLCDQRVAADPSLFTSDVAAAARLMRTLRAAVTDFKPHTPAQLAGLWCPTWPALEVSATWALPLLAPQHNEQRATEFERQVVTAFAQKFDFSQLKWGPQSITVEDVGPTGAQAVVNVATPQHWEPAPAPAPQLRSTEEELLAELTAAPRATSTGQQRRRRPAGRAPAGASAAPRGTSAAAGAAPGGDAAAAEVAAPGGGQTPQPTQPSQTPDQPASRTVVSDAGARYQEHVAEHDAMWGATLLYQKETDAEQARRVDSGEAQEAAARYQQHALEQKAFWAASLQRQQEEDAARRQESERRAAAEAEAAAQNAERALEAYHAQNELLEANRAQLRVETGIAVERIIRADDACQQYSAGIEQLKRWYLTESNHHTQAELLRRIDKLHESLQSRVIHLQLQEVFRSMDRTHVWDIAEQELYRAGSPQEKESSIFAAGTPVAETPAPLADASAPLKIATDDESSDYRALYARSMSYLDADDTKYDWQPPAAAPPAAPAATLSVDPSSQPAAGGAPATRAPSAARTQPPASRAATRQRPRRR